MEQEWQPTASHISLSEYSSAKNLKFAEIPNNIITAMTQIVMTIPNDEVNFLTLLAQKMGWKYRTANALDRFIASSPTEVNISDEEIQEEVNAVRYSK